MAMVKRLATGFLLACALAQPVVSGAPENALIAKVYETYGGGALTSMHGLEVRDRYKMVVIDGGRRPGEDAVSRLHSTLWVDFKTGRKAVRNWADGPTGKRLSQIIFDGATGWSVNHLRGTHVRRDDLNADNVGRGMMRLLDTTVAWQLIAAADTAVLGDMEYVYGRQVRRLDFKDRTGATVSVFVDPDTGLLRRAVYGVSRYDYHGHTTSGGITFATDTNLLVSGRSRLLTIDREIKPNPDLTGVFDIPRTSRKLDGMRGSDTQEIVVAGANTYLVGKGFSATLFHDAGDYFIAAGGLAGIAARLDALNQHLSSDKRLGYLVVPEHHPSHTGGLIEAAGLGAVLVVAESHKAFIQASNAMGVQEPQFLAVSDKIQLAGGRVIVIPTETSQSADYLLFHVPEAKLVFTVDDFGTNVLNAVPPANRRTVSFWRSLDALALDVEQIAYIHGTGLLTLSDLRQAADAFLEAGCPPGFPVCAD